jgi:hypothetical protein
METPGPILGDKLSVADNGVMRRELDDVSGGVEVVHFGEATNAHREAL